jgi:hypothetical protein
MATFTVQVLKGKYAGLSATIAASDLGTAIDQAAVKFTATHPELAGCAWDLKRMIPTSTDAFTATVKPV